VINDEVIYKIPGLSSTSKPEALEKNQKKD
jgi:hypothetical protein